MKTEDPKEGFLVIDGMHRATAVQELLTDEVLLVEKMDHMVRPRKARAENV